MIRPRAVVTGGSGFIGTNLVEHLLRADWEVLSLDCEPPRNERHRPRWQHCDVLHAEELTAHVSNFAPHTVFHLAARTDLNGADLGAYSTNTLGVRNLIDGLRYVPHLRRALFFSSMLVCKLGYMPKTDTDYCPTTVYGESKAEGERLVRSLAGEAYSWAIVRPTSHWGPWFRVPYRSFFDAVVTGSYVHPRGQDPRRTYGFVGNSVAQIEAIACADSSRVHRSLFYLGDYDSVSVLNWANVIRGRLRKPPVRELPLFVFQAAARLGDLAKRLGVRDPAITSFRLSNLMTNAVYDLSATRALCPDLPYTFADSVAMTLTWLENGGEHGTA
jgi:GlcNAc-P-P-Und epimerase